MESKGKGRFHPRGGTSAYPLNWAERLTAPIADPLPEGPPKGLWPFLWYFIRQTGWLIPVIIFVTFVQVVIDLALPVSMGWLIDQLKLTDQGVEFNVSGWVLVGFVVLFAIAAPLATAARGMFVTMSMFTGFGNMVRWQSHWHVLGHDMAYFNNDFAGRIASRVIDTGRSVQTVVLRTIDTAIFFILYICGALIIFAFAAPILMVPLAIWAVAYIICIFYLMPEMRKRSREHSRLRARMTGRIVDSYTNISTVKLFAGKETEIRGAADAIDHFNFAWARVMRLNFTIDVLIVTLNGLLVVATAIFAFSLAINNHITPGVVVAALPIIFRITGRSQIMLQEVAWIFESVGSVDDGQKTISHQPTVTDAPDAPALAFDKGEIRFDQVAFNYGKTGGLFEGLSFTVKPGEKIGLVGRSGSGKTSIVNLLLRFYDPDGGRVLIDGQDIASVTQDSLRGHIGVVTQDPNLMHRSIGDNIRYGRPDATDAEMKAAAQQAEALQFIDEAVDQNGKTGFDAEIGERGVKLSGGQRQRIAIARVILKDAPILILDEATSALDSEVEAAIQSQLEQLLEGRTTIAIAHRLSTIAKMDRLIIMDQGRIIEEGTHEELIKAGGHYATLWSLQSGGFLASDDA